MIKDEVIKLINVIFIACNGNRWESGSEVHAKLPNCSNTSTSSALVMRTLEV